jgi:hypothetical protein
MYLKLWNGKILSDLEPLKGSSNKKTLYSFHSRFKMAHSFQKNPIYTRTH